MSLQTSVGVSSEGVEDMRGRFAAALDALNAPPDVLATCLVSWGIKGHPGDSVFCPLAQLLTRFMAAPCVVGEANAAVRVSATVAIELPLPVMASDFVRRFDAGNYPEVMAP